MRKRFLFIWKPDNTLQEWGQVGNCLGVKKILERDFGVLSGDDSQIKTSAAGWELGGV